MGPTHPIYTQKQTDRCPRGAYSACQVNPFLPEAWVGYGKVPAHVLPYSRHLHVLMLDGTLGGWQALTERSKQQLLEDRPALDEITQLVKDWETHLKATSSLPTHFERVALTALIFSGSSGECVV